MSKNKFRPAKSKAAEIITIDLSGSSREPNLRTDFTENPVLESPAGTSRPVTNKTVAAIRRHWWAIALVTLFSLGTLGASLKYLDESAQRQMAERRRAGDRRASEESAFSKLNPFLSAPPPPPTPQLSKEYIYAGQRLLAVEDANANPAVPADLAVWRPANGTWYVMGPGSTLAAAAGWGAGNDIPAAGDYDGDGKTDFAVYRPSNNTFYVIKSSDGTYLFQSFGAAGDQAVPADYDGDRLTDIAVYRPSNSTWYIYRSSDATVQIINYGGTGVIPAPADFDGDGRADAAVFLASNSTFYVLRSSDGGTQTGQVSATITAGGVPVPADYDGDGKADYAMRSGNDWLLKPAAGGAAQTVTWYAAGDTAVANDYDGDGKTDIAVWRPATGVWYIRQSSHLGQSNELRAENWGMSGDIPAPALWRR